MRPSSAIERAIEKSACRTNGAANNTAVSGRAKNASPIAPPATAAATADSSRTLRRYATANTRLSVVVGAYGRNAEVVTSASGDAAKRMEATTPTRRSKATDPSTYASAALAAATTASVTRGSPNSAIETANIAAGTGAYFG